MNTVRIISSFFLLFFFSFIKAQTNDSTKTKGNTSEEIVTKIIRIKGANGEEKIIEQQEVITKTSKIQLKPEDQDKTNQSANYLPPEVHVKKSGPTSTEKTYSKIANETGFVITLQDETGEKVSYAMLLSNGYYLVHLEEKNNCLGHFDKNDQLILERFDPITKSLQNVTYHHQPIK